MNYNNEEIIIQLNEWLLPVLLKVTVKNNNDSVTFEQWVSECFVGLWDVPWSVSRQPTLLRHNTVFRFLEMLPTVQSEMCRKMLYCLFAATSSRLLQWVPLSENLGGVSRNLI